MDNEWSALVGEYLRHLGTVSVVAALFAAAAHVTYYRIKGYTITLVAILSKAFAAGAVPPGVGLILCSTSMEHLRQIANIELYIAAAGVCCLYISWLLLFPKRAPASNSNSE